MHNQEEQVVDGKRAAFEFEPKGEDCSSSILGNSLLHSDGVGVDLTQQWKHEEELTISSLQQNVPFIGDKVDSVSDGFPFKIEDILGERTVLLERKYLDETIKVEVDMPNVEVEEGNDDDDNTESNAPPSVQLVVKISKDNSSKFLEIGVTAFSDEISIDILVIKDSSIFEDQLAYEGPDFNDLDENLQKAFHKYLEIRGIKPNTTNFLLEYMTEKDNRKYLKWLNNIKDSVGKKA
ncbi:hypothetical protein K2173_022839 [Erythroxylum novogranatense]|uniref:Mitochondrial glycoprotein n=1 Tax=Erythroxylum novogranatense TaxID=1862640 RepID=A0AAV8SN23_9ROSI|nr:hypothetical protein K2173_022839 [Erythroxylum novogranatense]